MTRTSQIRTLAAAALVVASTLVGCATSSCIVEGTRINTPDGLRLVETLRPGDRVVARTPSGEFQQDEVVATRSHSVESHLVLRLERGIVLRVTGTHPVATVRGWVIARELVRGDQLLASGGTAQLLSIRRRAGRVNVFDLAVREFGNFIADGVLVHNKKVAAYRHPSDVVGVWEGYVADAPDFCRLTLFANGTGALVNSVLGSIESLTIEDWTVQGFEVRIRSGAAEFSGRLVDGVLRIELGKIEGERSVTLLRESHRATLEARVRGR